MMSLKKSWLSLFVLLRMTICITMARNSVDCFTAVNNYRCHFTTLTPYRFIANMNDSVIEYTDCSPRKMWILVRHGTRYPSKKWSTKMSNELPKILHIIVQKHIQGLGTLANRIVEHLQNWRPSFSLKDAMNLASEGERELVGIAERFQSRYPSLMPENYSNRTYMFKYTATQRAEESAKHFTLGLFGREQAQNINYPVPETKDCVLRFYKNCIRWREEVADNPESLKENKKFLNSSIVKDMLKDVSGRVGFDIDFDRVNLIRKICAFETAWDEKKNSPWCNILSVDNMKVLDFEHDLKYYWIDGYGNELTYKQACIAIKDMFDFIESNDETKTTAYFAHSGTILKMLAFLGVAKDKNILRHDSFSSSVNRAWKTSLIDAFGSNLAFVAYDCNNQGPSVLVMHQERIIQLPGCPKNAPCPISTMKNEYPVTDSECPFDEMCGIEKTCNKDPL